LEDPVKPLNTPNFGKRVAQNILNMDELTNMPEELSTQKKPLRVESATELMSPKKT
jgi:hypothetical protein